MNAIESIRSRSMYRGRLQACRLASEDVVQLIEAAGWAPSGHNSQPWEFMVVDDSELNLRIAGIASANFDSFLEDSTELRRFVGHFGCWLRWSEQELIDAGDGVHFARMSQAVWQEPDAMTGIEGIRKCLMGILGSLGTPSRLTSTAPCRVITLVNALRRPIAAVMHHNRY